MTQYTVQRSKSEENQPGVDLAEPDATALPVDGPLGCCGGNPGVWLGWEGAGQGAGWGHAFHSAEFLHPCMRRRTTTPRSLHVKGAGRFSEILWRCVRCGMKAAPSSEAMSSAVHLRAREHPLGLTDARGCAGQPGSMAPARRAEASLG